MQKYCVFGNPVEHSLSPIMHNFAFETLKIKAYYVRHLLQKTNELKEVFLSQNYNGANITLPFKKDAFSLADKVLGIAKEIAAVNTFVLKNKKLLGFNTDAIGFFKAISQKTNFKNALIVGAGGTARAIVCILHHKKKDFLIANRSSQKLDFFKNAGFKTALAQDLDYFNFDVIINTTSAGLNDDNLPLPKKKLTKLSKNNPFFFDVIYGKKTPFLELAKKKNLQFCDGLDMLIWQGAFAFCHFQDLTNPQKIYKIMKNGLKEFIKLKSFH